MKKNVYVLASFLSIALAGGMMTSCAGNQNKKEAAAPATALQMTWYPQPLFLNISVPDFKPS